MAVKGRLVSVGRLGKTYGELDLDLLARKRLHLIGVTFRTRTLNEKISIAREVIANLIPPLTKGQIRPLIDSIFALDDAPKAKAYMESNVQIGKIVFSVK